MVDSVLQLVYRQALIWAGMFFCPVLPLMGVLANALYFQVNKVLVSGSVTKSPSASVLCGFSRTYCSNLLPCMACPLLYLFCWLELSMAAMFE